VVAIVGLRKLEDRPDNPRSIYWFPRTFLTVVSIQLRRDGLGETARK
jgi:hypothetical protein